MFGQSQNTLTELLYTNYSIILKQPTKAYIPVPFTEAYENVIITDTPMASDGNKHHSNDSLLGE